MGRLASKLLRQAHQKVAFLAVGTLAFGVDAGLLWFLIHHGGSPWVARMLSLAVAMVVAWLANRWLTFGVTTPPSWSEFLRYVSLAGAIALLNYTLFLSLLALGVVTHPILATGISTLVCMVASFVGMQAYVFAAKKPR
jgi:putative flippase GtrA